ncbi:MAG TPA: hypothetical protein VIY48_22060 [Candidatus Paceibacterota bacterium]
MTIPSSDDVCPNCGEDLVNGVCVNDECEESPHYDPTELNEDDELVEDDEDFDDEEGDLDTDADTKGL